MYKTRAPRQKKKNKMTLLRVLNQEIQTTEQFKRALERLKRPYACEACGLKKEQMLTKHHKVRQSIKKDNRMLNLACLCRDCHDDVEKFYDWIISFNAPMLWKVYKDISHKVSGISSVITSIQDLNSGFPPIHRLEKYGVDEHFYWNLTRREQVDFLNNTKKVIKVSRAAAEDELNKAILKRVDFNMLYRHSLEYARSKRSKV